MEPMTPFTSAVLEQSSTSPKFVSSLFDEFAGGKIGQNLMNFNFEWNSQADSDSSTEYFYTLPSSDVESPISMVVSTTTGNSNAEANVMFGHQPAVVHTNRTHPPMTSAKHICGICGDRASGKHYGVYSCEGCKGFFKRTVRKNLTYNCRENRNCTIDKRQRNRCQYCRYKKCQLMGMKREAVQEERQCGGGGSAGSRCWTSASSSTDSATSTEAESTTDDLNNSSSSSASYLPMFSSNDVTPLRIFQAELHMGNLADAFSNETSDGIMRQLVEWAIMLPMFSQLHIDDQALLIHSGWHELMLVSLLYRWGAAAGPKDDGSVSQCWADKAKQDEIVSTFALVQLDRVEVGFLRAVVLFNPEVGGLRHADEVESCREQLFLCMEQHCRHRLGRLLLRLPAVRSLSIAAPLPHAAVSIRRLVETLVSFQNASITSSNLLLVVH